MSLVQVVVRRARADDEPARAALMRRSLQHAYPQTCLYFFCQELTLEGCVLGAAVLFIFAGAAPLLCAAVLPAAALIVAAAVLVAGRRRADAQLQALRGEAAGWVAEAPALAAAPRHCSVRQIEPADLAPGSCRQVVGTVSVSRHERAPRRGWLHALHVDPRWRRRGVGRALETAARREAARRRLQALEALTSELQQAARACLHAAGWALAGACERRVLGAALTLPLALLRLDLPRAPAPAPAPDLLEESVRHSDMMAYRT